MIKLKWFVWLMVFIIVIYLLHPFILRRLFPVEYKEEIIKFSREYDVDPFLIAAIIRVESNFNPYAVSPKDARGLMQIMPSTGIWAAEEMSLDDFYIEELYVVDTNIQIGCWYLRRLKQQFQGNIRLVLAAYNGGSGNVSKWLSDERYSTDGTELEYIPFAETRNYIEKVSFYQGIYKRIYNFKT